MKLMKGDYLDDEDEDAYAVGNPYKLVKRGGRWLVVKRESGQVVPSGDHGRDKQKALAHFRVLEMAYQGESE